jgi:TldD protein
VPTPKVVANWKGAFEKDPFDISVDDKIQFLLKLNAAAQKNKGVSFVNSSLGFVNEQKFYASSDGARIEQYLIRTNPNFNVTAINRETGDFQTRTSLQSAQSAGYEYLEKYDWNYEAEQAGAEVVQKLTAKAGRAGQV